MITNLRKFLTVAFGTYLVGIALVVGTVTLVGTRVQETAGFGLFYLGIAVLALGFIFFTSKSSAHSLHMRNDAEFKAWRKRERPYEFIAWAIIVAGSLMAITGYVILQFL